MEMDNKIIDESIQGQVLKFETKNTAGKKLFLESYGCQMNFSDSEIVASILTEKGFSMTQNFEEADLIFINTCAIRENAELRVRKKIPNY
jgi:tRNA-2-methylthio-N6-dimethylallyladenosine synthase